MTDQQAVKVLRTRGFGVGAPDVRSGKVRVWVRGGSSAVDVRMGKELSDLAAGKLTVDEICERREDEVVVER